MARELSPTLAEAQKIGCVTWPYLVAKIKRRWGGVIRYGDFVNLYSGAEGEHNHTAAMPSDGSLIRLYTSDPSPGNLYYQRVINPNEASNYSSWAYQSLYTINAVASCAYGTNVAQFAIKANREIRFRESSDCGASWSSWSILDYVTSGTPLFADAAYKSNGNLTLAAVTSLNLYVWKRTSGSWAAAVSPTGEPANITGVSVCYNSDWNIIVSYGAAAAVSGLQQIIYGDGGSYSVGTWSAWQTIISRASSDPYIYYAPFVRRPDTTRLFFCESYTDPTAVNPILYSHSPTNMDFDDCAWLEPVPMELSSAKGFCPTTYGDYVWLTSANKVYRASAIDSELDITRKLLVVDINQSPDILKGKLKLTVDNTAGVYNTFARVGDEITIGLGFVTGAGNEYSLTSSFWITKHKLVSPTWSLWRSIYPTGILGTLEIEAEDAWHFLKRQKSRRAVTWTAGQKTVKQLLTYFLARAGLELDVISESTAITTFQPAFTLNSGGAFATAVKNLLKMVPDQLVFRESKAYIRNPTTAEAEDWIYHNIIGTGIMVFRGKYGSSGWDPNRVEVIGTTIMESGAEYPEIQKMRDRLTRVTSPDYPNSTRALERIAADLRKSEILTGEDSWLFAMVNCGLEPWDKLKITDQSAGVANIYRRAIRIKTYWTKLTYQYAQTLTLGAD